MWGTSSAVVSVGVQSFPITLDHAGRLAGCLDTVDVRWCSCPVVMGTTHAWTSAGVWP